VRTESKDTWRDSTGFGRPEDIGHNTWSQVGPDDEDHAVGCMFIMRRGILPCSCDATRRERSEWWKRWLRWQEARVMPSNRANRTKWPVTGPDGDPWVPGVDFNDEEEES
jgi:hypothetical protein